MYNQPINPVGANEPLDPFWMRAMDSVPTAAQGLLWNAGRGSKMVMEGLNNGGKGQRAWKNTGRIRDSVSNTLRPTNWTKFGNYDAMYAERLNSSGKTASYTPFQALARGGNYIAEKANLGGKYLNYSDLGQNAAGRRSLFGVGTASRFTSNAKIAAGRASPGLSSFLNDAARRTNVTGVGVHTMGGKVPTPGATFFASDADDMLKMAASSEGVISRHLLGYQAGAMRGSSISAGQSLARTAGFESVAGGYANAIADMGKAGLDVVDGSLMRAGSKVGGMRAITGASKGARMSAAKVVGMRGLTAASKFAGPVGWAMLAYDAGKLIGNGMKSAISLTGDAIESMQGSMNKPIFGMGYKDTQFAATSRARGVMAIQNSRMNARNVLGNEAGMVAAHFG